MGDGLETCESHDRREWKSEGNTHPDHTPHRIVRTTEPRNVNVMSCEQAEERVEVTIVRIKNIPPYHGHKDEGDGPGRKDYRACERSPPKGLIQNQRQAHGNRRGDEDHRDGPHKRLPHDLWKDWVSQEAAEIFECRKANG